MNASARRAPRRSLAVLLSWALLLPMLVVGGVTIGAAGPAAAAGVLTVSKSAPKQALVGDAVTYEITAKNTGDAPLYNLSLRDVLPVGLTYDATSTAAAGDPTTYPSTPPAPGQAQTVIWSNIADLQPNSYFTLVFTVTPDPVQLPVGAGVTNAGEAYASPSARVVQRFDELGVPLPTPNVDSAKSNPSTTQFTAIEVRKTEPSPEGELVRGVHDNTTTYTLEIQNNDALATTGVTVVDYLPAALEFLHCGEVDNSPDGLVEYTEPPAPRLTVVPPPAGEGVCPPVGGTSTPRIDSIDTATLAVGNAQGYQPGVYTRVEYVLGNLAPDQTVTLTYRAGIPMNENVEFTDPAPTPESGAQAANLANNTGPSTRETLGEQEITNHVTATGIYTGPILDDPDGGPVTATDEVTRSIEDLAMDKSVTPVEFTQDQIATYTLTLRGSEYVTSSDVVVTDVLPNGVCPLAAPGTPGADSDCVSATNGPSTDYATYVYADDGTTTITFEPVSVARNGTMTITYSARMREFYGGTPEETGGLAGQPIATGDSFTNVVTLTGTTTTAVEGGQTQESGTEDVLDASQATLTSSGGELAKAIKPRDSSFALAYDCDGPTSIPPNGANSDPTPFGDTADFLADPDFDDNRLAFRKGDRVCFQITAKFSTTTQTRNAVVTDFLPVGTSYEPNSFQLVGPTGVGAEVGENTLTSAEVTFNEPAAAAGTQDPVWLLGTTVPGTTDRTLPLGAIFQARFSVIVERSAIRDDVEIVGNLVKMRTENSAGQAQSFRDREDFGIIPPPPLPTVKGVAEVNSVSTGTWNPTTGNDNIVVKQGDVVTYRVDLANQGTLADANVVAARQIDLWDVLPVGITCTDVDLDSVTYEPAVNDAMTVACYDPGASIPTTPPTGSAATTTPTGRSVIRWKDTAVPDTLDGPGTIDSNQNSLWAPEQLTQNPPVAPAGATATRSYFYQVRVPAQVSVGTRLPNTAGVRQYGVLNSLQDVVPYFPLANVDPTIPVTDLDAPRSRDDSLIFLPGVSATKGVTSQVNETGNIGAEAAPGASTQAVPGEVVTYTVVGRIPAQTTVYNATFTDPLPAGQQLLSATADWAAGGDPDGQWSTTLPTGVSLATAATPPAATLSFPTVYNNSTTTDQLFRMTITARVLASVPTNAQGAAIRNTATFSSTPAADGTGTALTASANATVNVVEPKPTIEKSTSGDLNGNVVGGQTVDFTLKVTNTAGRPPLHDSWVVDCVPTGLENPTYTTTSPAGIPTLPAAPGTGTLGAPGNGCATGTTRLAWNVGLIEAANDPVELRYTVTVTTTAVGAQSYTNVATVSGNSLAGVRTDPTQPGNTDGRPYSASDDLTLKVAGAGSFKSVDKPNATIGEIVTYTISAELPPNVNFYDVALIDTLPLGVAPEPTGGRPTAVVSTQCRSAVTDQTCDPDITPTPLTSSPAAVNPATANVIGLFLGDLGPSTQLRIVKVVYTARVVNVPTNLSGTDLVNSVVTRWNLINGTDPTSVNPPGQWTQASTPKTTTVNVTQPSLTITKGVNDATVEPGQVFTYTVQVTNASGPDVSAAFDVTVTDNVPAGVIVNPASLVAAGGVLTGTNPDGSDGTITWTIPGPLQPGASQKFTYSAKLAASPTINATGKRNTADVGTYYSLPADYEFGFPDSPDGPLDRREYNGPSASRTVTPQFPALTAVKTAPNGPIAYVGDEFTWQFTVTNSGTGAAQDVDLIDVLPPNWRYQPDSASVTFGSAGSQALNPATSLDGVVQTLTWTNAGNLGVGQQATVTFRAVPLPAATTNPGAGSSIAHTNTVRATADDASGASGNLTGPYQSNLATAVARIHAADVAIAKTAGDFVAGATGTFRLTVSNNGPDPAVGPFLVTDPLPATPAGLSYVSAQGTGWSCSLLPVAGTPGTVQCTRTNAADTLAASGAGAQFPPITITVAVDDDVESGTTYDNTATARAKTYDPNLANNSDPATATVRAEADLAIVKKLSSPLVAGQDATYTIDVTNLGPSVSRADIVVTDTLPPGAIFRSASGDGWGPCTEDAGVVTCTRTTDLAVGVSAGQITLVIGIPSSQTADVVNTATVTGTTPETTDTNNTSTVTTPVTLAANLAIEKRHVGEFIAGESGLYQLQVLNFGPSDAGAAVRITDTLPDGLTFSSVTSTSGAWGCATAGQDLTCTRGTAGGGTPTTMPAGTGTDPTTPETLTLTVAIAANLPVGDIANTATITSPTPDPVPDNNTDGDLTGTDTLADLSIVKTVEPDPVTAGEQVTYTLQVANGGPSVARQLITVSDVLPAGLSWPGPGSATGAGWVCGYTDADRMVTCTRDQDLAAPDSPTDDPIEAPPITLDLDVDPDAGPATIVNSATVKSPTNDPDLTNNESDVPVEIVDAAEISLAKTWDGDAPVTAGTATTFTLVVTNEGPSDADSIVVLDTMPAGLIPQSATGDGWTCAEPVGLTIQCSRLTLAAGPDGAPLAGPPITVTALVDASVPDDSELENSATVRTSTDGDDPQNNSDTAIVPVVAIADLTLVKTARDLPAGEMLEAGEQVTYDLLVTNAGDPEQGTSDAVAEVTVVDTLPAGFTYAGTAGTGWECTAETGTTDPATGDVITCVLGEAPDFAPLPAGATAPLLSVLVSIDPTVVGGEYTNDAVVSTPTTEVTLANNDSSATVQVGEVADLSIVKSHTGAARVGDPLEFTLQVRNDGPSVARGVVVTDELPTGLTYVSAGADPWTCSADDQLVTCALDDALDPATDAEPITLTVTVEPEAYPSVVNPAEVSSETPDSDDSNNSDTDEVAVPPLVDLAVAKSHTGAFQVGQQAGYTIVVTNNGPTPAPDVVITDTIPAGLTFVSAAGSGVECLAEGQLVTCTADEPMAPGDVLSITLTVDVLPAAYPGVTNTVSVSSPAEETDTENNTATDPAVVSPLVDLDLTKELISQDSDRAVFEIVVTNNGPNATVDPIVVVDDLPVGLELVAAQGTDWECGVTEPVTCTYPQSLAVGASASFGVVATITAPPETTVTNVATATAGCSPAPVGGGATTPVTTQEAPVDCGRAEAELTTPPESDIDGGGDDNNEGSGNDGSGNDGLADTGARVGALALFAMALITLGGAAIMTSRSRREA